jgi:protein-tyrosine phosphatase
MIVVDANVTARGSHLPFAPPCTLPAAEREAHRRLAVEGMHNLRDLGGYPALDGHTVRWGVLYRSDHLGRLTDRGLAQLGALGLTALIDLRTGPEKEETPDRLPDAGALRVVDLPIADVTREPGSELRQRLARGDVAGLDVPAVMVRTYRQFGVRFAPEFRQVVDEVLRAQGRPLLFHCTAGKDRTGFAAALLLRLLGVPEEAVLRDYLLSTRYCLEAWGKDIETLRALRGREAAQAVRQFCTAEAPYLEAAFEAIDGAFGSFDAYAQQALGLGEEELARLRGTLLEG